MSKILYCMHFPKILQRKNQVRSRDRKTKRELRVVQSGWSTEGQSKRSWSRGIVSHSLPLRALGATDFFKKGNYMVNSVMERLTAYK